MTILITILACIGATTVMTFLVLIVAAFFLTRNDRRRADPARLAALARHPAGGRERHLHAVRDTGSAA